MSDKKKKKKMGFLEAKVIIGGEVCGDEWKLQQIKFLHFYLQKKKKIQYCFCDFPKEGKKYIKRLILAIKSQRDVKFFLP